jgi:antitoxin (DNA-binding transcriptional repressor) of toxin-antitoxin stability system
VIAKDGKPLAALVPVAKVAKAASKFGSLKGKIHLADDTPETDAEIEQLFTEGETFPR